MDPQHNRSPAALHATGGFPKFTDGDVVISSGAGMTWKLHSTTIRNASSKLRKLIDNVEGRKINAKQREEGKLTRWRIDMVSWADKPEDTRFRDFVVIAHGSKEAATFRFPELGNSNDAQFHRIYDNLFRCFYNIDPVFSDAEKSSGAYHILDAISLLQAAEHIDAAATVRLRIEAHLLRLNQHLWHHIERNSESWADIAVRIESPMIFREAMLHIIGRFDLSGNGDVRGVNKELIQAQENGQCILELAQRKAQELNDKKLAVERLLMQHYPHKMVHNETERDIPGRAVYATDIYLWQGLCLVRQYLNSCVLSNMHHSSADGGVSFYRSIGEGGESYLRNDTLDRFHESFGMSSKGKQCLRAGVEYIKTCLQPIVKDLLVDLTQTSGQQQAKLPYLTCTEILDKELPWVIRRAEQNQKHKEAAAETGFSGTSVLGMG